MGGGGGGGRGPHAPALPLWRRALQVELCRSSFAGRAMQDVRQADELCWPSSVERGLQYRRADHTSARTGRALQAELCRAPHLRNRRVLFARGWRLEMANRGLSDTAHAPHGQHSRHQHQSPGSNESCRKRTRRWAEGPATFADTGILPHALGESVGHADPWQ